MTYDDFVKVARMRATRDIFAGGRLEILGAGDTPLVVYRLTQEGGSVTGAGEWNIGLSSYTVQASSGNNTKATAARMVTSGGKARLTGLTVGRDKANVTLNSDTITEGQDVKLLSVKIIHAP
jgi:hypothetical protein